MCTSRYSKMDHFHRTVDVNFDRLINNSWLKHKDRWRGNDRLRKKFIKHLQVYVSKGLWWAFCKWYKNSQLKEFAEKSCIPELKGLVTEDWFKKNWKEHQNEMIDVAYEVALRNVVEEEDKNALDLIRRAAA